MAEPGFLSELSGRSTGDAPSGLCPRCLMGMALELSAEPSESLPAEGLAADAAIPESDRSSAITSCWGGSRAAGWG